MFEAKGKKFIQWKDIVSLGLDKTAFTSALEMDLDYLYEWNRHIFSAPDGFYVKLVDPIDLDGKRIELLENANVLLHSNQFLKIIHNAESICYGLISDMQFTFVSFYPEKYYATNYDYDYSIQIVDNDKIGY